MNKNIHDHDIILVGIVGNHHSLYKEIITFISEIYRNLTFITTASISKYIFDDYRNKAVTIHISDCVQDDKVFKKYIKLINNHKIIIIDEYYGNYFHLYNFAIRNNVVISILHNPNKLFNRQYTFNIKNSLNSFGKKIFLKKVNVFMTMGPNISDYLKFMDSSRPIFYFPFEWSDTILPEVDKQIISIVIPGMISEKRREYGQILETFNKYYCKNPDSRIRLKLLGKIHSERESYIADLCEKINEKHGKRISYWNEYIPKDYYDKELSQASWILSNARVFNRIGDSDEIYGITKISGVSYVIYKYAKPALVPYMHNILSGFDNQLIRYDSYEMLYSSLANIEANKISWTELYHNAIANKLRYNQKILMEKRRLRLYLTSCIDSSYEK